MHKNRSDKKQKKKNRRQKQNKEQHKNKKKTNKTVKENEQHTITLRKYLLLCACIGLRLRFAYFLTASVC